MSCCGGNKNRVIPAGVASVPQPPAESAPAARASGAVFRYDGARPLTTYGSVTGRKYWFAGTGAEAVVDLRDRAAMRRLAGLSEVRLV
jgi:hypothetical protein